MCLNTGQHDNIEKDQQNDEEVKLQDDVNMESFSATEVIEEKCMEEEDMQTKGEPKQEDKVSGSVEDTSQVEDEANVHIKKESGKSKTQKKDSETSLEVMSETEAPELSTEFENPNKLETSDEATASSEPEKQSEEPAGVNYSTKEKVFSEKV